MTATMPIRVDMTRAIDYTELKAHEVTPAIRALLDKYCPTTGGLVKIGSCTHTQLDKRPFSSTQYRPEYFDTNMARCVMFNIPDTHTARALETVGIQHLYYTLKTGVNTRLIETSDDMRPNLHALYVNHVVDEYKFKTQDEYKSIHVTTHHSTSGGITPSQLGRARIAQGLSRITPSQLGETPS